MKITGKASEIIDAIQYAREQMELTFEELRLRTDKSKERWIAKKLRWWGRSRTYWENKWGFSSEKRFTEQCNGTAWLQDQQDHLDTLSQQIDALPYFSQYTLNEYEVKALAYEHKDY